MKRFKKNKMLEEKKKETYGNESFGIPKDCTKKQKFNGVKLALYMVVVAFICCLGYMGLRALTERYLPEMTFDKSTQPIVYVKGKELLARQYRTKRGKVLAKSVELYEEDGGKVVSVSKKGKMIFYAENRTKENTYDLYCRSLTDLQKEEAKGIFIAKQVANYKCHPEGKFALYIKDDSLFLWEKDDTRLISDEVTEYYFSKNGQYIIYYQEGGNVYTCPVGKEAEPMLVDTDIEKVISEKEEYQEIYYIKNETLFLKEPDDERVVLAEQVADAFLLGDALYCIKQEPHTWAFEEIFLDDRAEYDETIEKPEKTDISVSATEAEENAKRYEEKTFRDFIRTYFEENPVVTEQYHLYQVRGDELELVDNGLVRGEMTFQSCHSAVLYEKYLEPQEKTRISTITTHEEALAEAARVTGHLENSKIATAVLVENKEPYIGMEEVLKGRVEISLDGKYLYCLEDIGDDKKGVLVRYTIGAKALKDRIELCPVTSDFTVDGADSAAVIVFDGNRMGICMNKTYTQVAENKGPDFFYVDKTLYYIDAYNPDTQTGKLMCFRNGQVKEIDSGVHSFNVRNLKTVVYIKNFSRELGFGELYQKEGNRPRKKLDICVRNILH